MIRHQGSGFSAIRHLGSGIQAVYHGGVLVWQAVRSCFGSGVWVSRKPWIGSEKWKNNK